ncbi:MAG TPA: ATPase [Chloroflexi bacterium]|nr:ATPase [Chloroflexota bacterium]
MAVSADLLRDRERARPDPGRSGLSAVDAQARLVSSGPNDLVPAGPSGDVWTVVRSAVTDPMAALLVVASATYILLGNPRDAIVTLVALVPIVAVSVILELRAERALESLRRLTAPTAVVVRDGVEQRIHAREVVLGDRLLIREGDVVAADARLVEGTEVVLDESALTGESHPVTKLPIEDETALLFAGTTVRAGRGASIVTATGPRTRYGQIGTLVAAITPAPTPLQTLIRRLVIQLSIVAGAFCIAVVALELFRGSPIDAAIIAGVSLAMAAIPEEFPMVFTLYLGLGAWRLARDRALVRRLAGVETLGAASVICVDKTGTLTLGTIEVASIWTAPGFDEEAVLRAAVRASEPRPYDPVDIAIVHAAGARGLDVDALHAGELLRDHPFDANDRYVTHAWRTADGCAAYAKGSLEGILSHANTDPALRESVLSANQELAERGMRVIAVAESPRVSAEGDRTSDEQNLELRGLIAFVDPLRPGVNEALAECRAAGVRVIVITGDHPATAAAVAKAIGLDDGEVATGSDIDRADDASLALLVERVSVFARVRPEQKYRIVRALRASGHVVAMTGDGTNDAPALREADIGIAMGLRGTEVARSAATLVLMDDDFSTIVSAVRDGRRIFENLRHAFGYLIAFHVPLLLAALVVPIAGSPLLLFPVHLVWLEIVVHPTASLVFEADPPPSDLMRRPPRRRANDLLPRGSVLGMIARGVGLAIGVLALYLGTLDTGEDRARGLAIATLVMGQVFLVLAERAGEGPIWRAAAGGNRALVWILAATIGSLVLAEYVPFAAELLHVVAPSPLGWIVAAAVAAAGILPAEVLKRVQRRSLRSST